ncbi:AMRA1-like protein [Mya arenaria]|uniref:AMRA1-like protein n=1 Tax=Mya arenaria TaxID=6604 RepID=A0ABY7EDY7_MYAAR|nr:AMRA1-like protein [Mya arenaria]
MDLPVPVRNHYGDAGPRRASRWSHPTPGTKRNQALYKMNIASYLQERQYGKKRIGSSKCVSDFVEQKFTESFPCAISGRCRSTFVMQFSPDGTKVASTHGDHSIQVTELSSGRLVRTLTGHPRTPWSLAFHPSSSHILASGCLGGQVRIWDLYGHGCDVWETENSTVVASLTFHPVDHVLVIAAGNTLYFWDWSKPEPFAACKTTYEYERIRWVKFDGQGTHAAEPAGSGAFEGHPLLMPIDTANLDAQERALSQRQQEIRSNEILFLGYAQRLAQIPSSESGQGEQEEEEITGVQSQSTGNQRPSIQSVFGSPVSHDVLLDPASDPLLASAGNVEINTGDHGQIPQFGTSAFAPRFLAPPLRGVTSPPPNNQEHEDFPITTDIEVNLDSLLQHPPRLEYMRPSLSASAATFPISSQTFENNLTSDASISSSGSTHNEDLGRSERQSQPISSVTRHSHTNLFSLQLQGLMPTTTSSLVTVSTGTHSSKPFQSIRERLLSGQPLNPVTCSTTTTVHSQSDGIPKVTVIMSTTTQPVATTSRAAIGAGNPAQVGVIPTVTILPSMENSQLDLNTSARRLGIETTGTSELVNQPTSATRFAEPTYCDNSSSSNDSASALGSMHNIGNNETVPSAPSSLSDAPSSVIVDSGLLSRNVSAIPCQAQTLGNAGVEGSINQDVALEERLLQSNILGDLFPSSSSVVASTSSVTTLFQNILHRSGTLPECTTSSSATGLQRAPYSQTRAHPYLPPQSYQHRTRYMSIMGPYLESRGINPVVTLPSSMVLEERTHDIPAVPDNNATETASLSQHSRDQASSDTETELSAHLSTSAAYFLPISDDQRRSLSSTSLNRGTDSAVLRQFNASAESTDSALGNSSRGSSQGQEIELVVDQNENYTTHPVSTRNNIDSQNASSTQNISVRNQDDNNNSIHIVSSSNVQIQSTGSTLHHTGRNTSVQQRGNSASGGGGNPSGGALGERHDEYVRLRDSFVTMTDQIEREMNELNRRINALRDTFNQSIRNLRQDRHRYEALDTMLARETGTNLGPHNPVPGVPNMSSAPPRFGLQSLSQPSSSTTTGVVPGPPTLLESSLRSHQRQRHYLHPHYSSSILDETINRPNNAVQSAINRAIAGAFMGSGESAVANNIINHTHRIQAWDFSQCTVNVVVSHCKLHNDVSADISQTDTRLATFVPSHQGFPDDNILAVYSLEPATRGQCLYTKKFGPNAISVSMSPSNNYVLVGLAAKRLSWVFTSQQLVAQVYRLEKKQAGEKSMKHIKDVMHICDAETRTHVSGNSARWLPAPDKNTNILHIRDAVNNNDKE